VPTSTDLVKDGATAMEALGDAIDTSMVDLKGGTTGQVLAKASNTDMDFSWVAQDDSNAIQNTIVDAKGDLIAASAADTPARLAVGNNGETLVADSSTSTGLRYTAGTVQANPVLNSAFQIWQRGTTISPSGSVIYTADRWTAYNNNMTVSRQATGDTTNLPFIQYCARVQRTAGNTGTGAIYLINPFETINTIPYVGKTIAFSFYARRGANYSSTSNILIPRVTIGTGTDQNPLTSYTGGTDVINQSATLTTTWQRFTYTGTVPTTANEMWVGFQFDPTGTAGANDYFEVTGVQIDVGSVALPFRTYAATLQGELAACQRYYWRSGDAVSYQTFGTGIGKSSTVTGISVALPVSMRLVPQSLDYSNLAVFDGTTVVAVTSAVITAGQVDYNHGYLETTSASGVTQYRPYFLLRNGSTSGYVGFSAEL
jgi:hypothetical protein